MLWGAKKQKKKNDDDEDEDEGEVSCQNNHIYFYGDVTSKNMLRINQCINSLNQPGKRYGEIYLHINSGGGTVYDALSAVDTIIASPTPIVIMTEGIAASAAVLLVIVGDKRIMRPNAAMLVHQIRGGYYGKKSDFLDEAKNLETLEKRITQLFKDYTKLSASKISKMLGRELEYSAEECLTSGFIDVIQGKPPTLGKRKR